MKKIVSLAIACMLLLSCFAINAFAATTFDVTASAPDADGVFGVTFTSPVQLKLAKLAIFYPTDKMDVLDADTKEAVTGSEAGTAFAVESYTAHDQLQSKVFVGYLDAYTFTTDNANISDAGDIFTIYFKLKEGAKIEECPFSLVDNTTYKKAYGGINCTGSKSTETYRVTKGTAAANFDWEALKVEDPEPEFGASAAGTTITCFGKVAATATNYGVVFTKESTVEGARAQKYYGAMPGDTVKDYNGSTTFTFGDWDGSFEIILEGVHTGEKELDFFVDDTVIADTNFTVNVQ